MRVKKGERESVQKRDRRWKWVKDKKRVNLRGRKMERESDKNGKERKKGDSQKKIEKVRNTKFKKRL